MKRNPKSRAKPADVAAVQNLLSKHASALGKLSGQLLEIVNALPTSPDEDDMLNDLVPKDLPTEIAGILEYVVEEYLGPSRESLERLARVTAEDLRQEFFEAREKDRLEDHGFPPPGLTG